MKSTKKRVKTHRTHTVVKDEKCKMMKQLHKTIKMNKPIALRPYKIVGKSVASGKL